MDKETISLVWEILLIAGWVCLTMLPGVALFQMRTNKYLAEAFGKTVTAEALYLEFSKSNLYSISLTMVMGIVNWGIASWLMKLAK